MGRWLLLACVVATVVACGSFGAEQSETPADAGNAPPTGEQPQRDGGLGRDDAAAAPDDAATVDATDATDAQLQRCAQSTCVTLGGSCDGAGTCVRVCDSAEACIGAACPPGIRCRLACTTGNACRNVTCGEATSCDVACKVKDACFAGLSCGKATPCTVTCAAAASGTSCNTEIDCPRAATSTCSVACSGDCETNVNCCIGSVCAVDGMNKMTPEGYCSP